MGLFDDATKEAVPGGGLSKPLIIAAGALLAYKWFHKGDAPAEAPAQTQGNEADVDGGLLGGLGGLIEKFQKGGQGPVIDSWIGSGQNQPIQPGTLGQTLGQQTISDIAAKAGMSEQDLLAQLSQALPGLIDKLTPQGRLPTQNEIWNRGR